MQFIKRNYEKVLLGVVLLGLVVAAVFMLLLVSGEKQAQEQRRFANINRPVRPLAPVNLSYAEGLVKRAEAPFLLNYSDNTNRLFNPVRWQKDANGRVFKNPVGTDIDRLEITKITPLYLTVSLDTVNASESGVRYGIGVEQQAASRANLRGRRSIFMSVGEKKEYGEKKEPILLREVKGATNDPTELIFELGDERISVLKDKPFRRVEGYTADLKYPPENRNFPPGRRVGDKITLAGEEYNIVAITENEVVLSAKSNQKKWTIKYSAAP